MKKRIVILSLLVLMMLVVVPVSATDYSEELKYISTPKSDSYNLGWVGGIGAGLINKMTIHDIETYTTLSWVYSEDVVARYTYDVDSWSENVDMYAGATYLGNANFGFNHNYATGKIGIYLQVLSWNTHGLVGDQDITFTGSAYFNSNGLHNLCAVARSGAPGSHIMFRFVGAPGFDITTGDYLVYSQFTGSNYFTMTEIGNAVTIDVLKYSNTSLLTIYNGSGIVDAEGVLNVNPYTITTIKKPLKIKMTMIDGFWVNSSEFYNGSAPPSGPITTWIQAVDGQTSGAIHGANIQIHDINDGWVNTTDDWDGTSSISTDSTTQIEAFAQASGYSSASRYNLTPGNIVYELIMWPSSFPNATTYKVNLFVIVNDADTKQPIEGATVYVTPPNNAMTAGTTNAAGTETFVVDNKSLHRIAVSKSGYKYATAMITTTDWGPDTKRIELQKLAVTPTITSTPLPGEATVRPTLDTRTNAQKDQAMMDTVRSYAEILIPVACLMTLLYMFGYKP